MHTNNNSMSAATATPIDADITANVVSHLQKQGYTVTAGIRPSLYKCTRYGIADLSADGIAWNNDVVLDAIMLTLQEKAHNKDEVNLGVEATTTPPQQEKDPWYRYYAVAVYDNNQTVQLRGKF